MSGIWVSENKFVEFGEFETNKKSLADEIASRVTAFDYSWFMGILPDPDPVLQKRGDGPEILDSLTADGHLISVIQQRKLGTLKKEWKWKAGTGDDDKPDAGAEKLKTMLAADMKALKLYDVVAGILDAPLKGFTPLEIIWRAERDGWHIQELRVLPHRWFGFDEDNRPRFISLNNPWDGEELPWGKFVFARHFPDYDNPYGLRLLSRCFWPVMFKRGGIKFWIKFLEKYGMPFIFGRYPRGANSDEKSELLSNLARMVQDAVAVGPEGSGIELVGGGEKSKSSGDAFQALKKEMDREMSKVIMGQTLTTEVGERGSYAASRTHGEVRSEFLEADQMLIKTVMDEIAKIYAAVNSQGVEPPVFSFFEEADSKKEFAERDEILSRGGNIEFKESYYIRQYGYQKDDFNIVENRNPGADRSGGAFSEFAQGRRFSPNQQRIEDMVGELIERAENSLSGAEAAILKAVEGARSYEEAMERVLELYPDMDMKLFAEHMEHGVLAANLFGTYTAQREAADDD